VEQALGRGEVARVQRRGAHREDLLRARGHRS
jgi:hypothetical protein